MPHILFFVETHGRASLRGTAVRLYMLCIKLFDVRFLKAEMLFLIDGLQD